MIDIILIGDVEMAIVKDILDNVNAIREIAETTANLELKSAIIDLKEQVLDLRQENLKLKEKLIKQESYNMKFRSNAYYNICGNGEMEGPYCSGCWDGKNMAVRLHCRETGYTCCPVCKKEMWMDVNE